MTASAARPPGPPRPAPSQREAVWALMLAIFGGCCFYIPTIWAIVAGFRIINRSEFENVDHGRSLGVAAICVGAAQIGTTILSIAFVLISDSDSIYTGQYVGRPGNADPSIAQPFDLRRRECFDDPGLQGDAAINLRRVDCAKAHDAEVVDTLDFSSLRTFPGKRSLAAKAVDCGDSFAAYVGTEPRKSELALTYYYPNRTAWQDPGSRVITCVAWDPDGKLEDSVWRTER